MGSWRCSATHFLPRHWMEMSGQQHAQAAVHLVKNPQYLPNERLGGPQNQSGCVVERMNIINNVGSSI